MKPSLLIRMLCWCALLLPGMPSAWSAAGSADSPFRHYSVVDGLTQSDVFDIAQDRAGYLWISTGRGLNRYDGMRFDRFTIANDLPSNSLTALYTGSDDSVFVGDIHGGITVVQGSKVIQSIGPFDNMGAPIVDIEVVGQSILAVIEGVGIVELTLVDGKYDAQLIGGEDMGINNLIAFGEDVWASSTSGFYALVFEGGTKLEKRADGIRLAHADATGVIWLVDTDNRIGHWENNRFVSRATLATDNDIVDIAVDRQGLVWAATTNELFKIPTGGAEKDSDAVLIREFQGFDHISSLFVDRENSLWLDSRSRLIRFLGDRFEHFRLQTGFDPETVWAIAADPIGQYWYGTDSKLLLRQIDETLHVIGEENGVPEGPVRDVIVDDDGNIWFSVADKGLFRIAGNSTTAVSIENTFGLEIFDISLAPGGSIWFSTAAAGVFNYSNSDNKLSRFEAPGDSSVYTLDTADDGSVWYGADRVGLVHLRPSIGGNYEQTVYGSESGLENTLFNHINLNGLNSGWIAADEGGIYRFKNGKFENFGANTPLFDQSVYVVEPLDNGTVVVGGEQGLYQFIPGRAGYAHYTELGGFIGLESNAHATFIDSDKQLWIGTVNGVTRMDVEQPMPAQSQVLPNIISMESNLDRLPISDSGSVEPDQLGVRIEFAAISLLDPQWVEYSYRLLGAEASWGPATPHRSVSYPRIPAGDYEFMVRARYPGGAWSQEFASKRFTVLPHFWQQPWFLLFTALLALAILRAAMVNRTRKIERHNETLKAEVADRTQSIEEANRHLEFSNLQLLKEVENRKKSDSARAEIENRFRGAFENAPIGMGLLNADGQLFDMNPAMRNIFWPGTSLTPKVRFADVLEESDRERYEAHFSGLLNMSDEVFDKKYSCVNSEGEVVQTFVSLSPVVSDDGEFLYAVLQVQDVTESLKLTSQLEYQASYDELTGLLNRRAFETELNRACEKSDAGETPSFLMFMDLDQFKVVNDTSGHSAGDQLLKGVSKILVDNVRGNDIVARLGGDEFGIILWSCPTDVAKRIAESIRAGIDEYRFHWDAETYRIGVSIGGLQIEQSTGDINELQQLADAACYAAKEAGRNRVHIVAGDKDSARVRRGQVRWVQRLREAMDSNRFAIYGQNIQPLSDDGDEPENIEILLRLRDPESRTLVPPGAFLPAAERYGLSVELDQWVVGSLLDTLFVHQAFQAEHRTYWINLSGTSIGDQRFAAFLKRAIEHSPLPPGTINFEITETAVIRNVAEAGKLMTALKEMGCKFALDDFGSGLSSFGYLKKLPVDFLKIDGMFIRDIVQHETNRIFVKSIIDIARSLHIKTIAEFVENQDVLDLVKELGADYAQGFMVGRPFVLAPKLSNLTNAADEPFEIQTKAG